jgi:hypothetical protein
MWRVRFATAEEDMPYPVYAEGYAGLIGASSPTFKGTPKSMKAYPMALVSSSC